MEAPRGRKFPRAVKAELYTHIFSICYRALVPELNKEDIIGLLRGLAEKTFGIRIPEGALITPYVRRIPKFEEILVEIIKEALAKNPRLELIRKAVEEGDLAREFRLLFSGVKGEIPGKYWKSCKDIVDCLLDNFGKVERRSLKYRLPREYHKSTVSRAIRRLKLKGILVEEGGLLMFDKRNLPILSLFLEESYRSKSKPLSLS